MAKPKQNPLTKALSRQILEHEMNIDPAHQFDLVKILGKMTELGINEADIGLVLGIALQGKPIDRSRISYWMAKYPQLKKYIGDSRRKVLHYALMKLVRRACGYDYTEKVFKYTITTDPETGKRTSSPYEVTEHFKHSKPDTKALLFLICNLDNENWKNINKTDFDNRSVNLNFDGKATAKQIEALAGKLYGRKKKRIKQVEVKEI